MSDNEAIKILKRYAEECLSCGDCIQACSQALCRGIYPQEIAERVLSGNVSQTLVNLIRRCDLCGLCSVACRVNLKPEELMVAARQVLLDQEKINLDDYAGMLTDQVGNTFSLYREKFGIQYHDLKRDGFDSLFFPGCSLSTYAPELTRAAYGWLEDRGMVPGFSEGCCGKPLSNIGLGGCATRQQAPFLAQMQDAGARTLVVACPSCYYQLANSIPGIRVLSLYRLMKEAGVWVGAREMLTIHDSCPDREALLFGEDMRALLSASKIVEMEHHGRATLCCGSGGSVSKIDPELCRQRARLRLQEFKTSGAAELVTGCMACVHRLLRASPVHEPVVHILELVFDLPVDYYAIQANLQALWENTPQNAQAQLPATKSAVVFSPCLGDHETRRERDLFRRKCTGMKADTAGIESIVEGGL